MNAFARHMTRLLCCLICLMPCALQAQDSTVTLSPDAHVALLTCQPGDILYERYGHTGILILDDAQGIQHVYHYGVFDFNTDHFYWKFVRGETWYELGQAPLSYFAYPYRAQNRDIYVQWLRLSPEQKQTLWDALQVNYLPENRKYLYNFVFDNCATRPWQLILQAVGCPVTSAYTPDESLTYRRLLRRYTGAGSWADLGTNLLFGPRADRQMTIQDRLFLPEQLMLYLHHATLPDGTPLVEQEYIAPFPEPRTPWYATWYFGVALFALIMLLLNLFDAGRHRRTRWVDYLLYTLYALLLIIVCFLRFFSIHPLVGFGPYLLIIPTIHLCTRLIYILRR
ncbi:MAG: DUF4105 domain-containing protein [Paludibacteraceae bacterium]|nr:DUF4105 domain-containing protein [Paludibacteraceae bacterium]